MALAHILGYPRIGPHRELKVALEAYWRDESSAATLLSVAGRLKDDNWRTQRAAGLDMLAAGDHSLYDHILDTAQDLGVPPRRGATDDERLHEHFALARGGGDAHAMEMTKWFDTNYHYLVPELEEDQVFAPDPSRLLADARRCAIISTSAKVVMVGPLTFLWSSKCRGAPFDRLPLLPALLDAYVELFGALRRQGVEWIQLDEPCLVLEIGEEWIAAYERALSRWRQPKPRLLLTTYFESVECEPGRVCAWPYDGVHLDLVRAPGQLKPWADALPRDWVLSAGIVDGRNVWRNDLPRSLAGLEPVHAKLGDRLWVAPSCSLLHVPVSLAAERGVEDGVLRTLAFAEEKLAEVKTLAMALSDGRPIQEQAGAAKPAGKSGPPPAANRAGDFPERRAAQQAALRLPLLPTTTIGSFPQTPELRSVRASFRRHAIDETQYRERLREEVRRVIAAQEEAGLDVLVHGEPERNDMVEFFAEHLRGFATTAHGWVQSYGSRCVKPPIIHGDVSRPAPITVELATYAQSLTRRPVKGMLTGPVTILKWCFVREDLSGLDVAAQIAVCIRDEVDDLQRAGIRVIQIDEPALREAMPLRRRDAAAWLDSAVALFRLAASSARPETQVHTHMCYSEFGEILPAVAAMDADVVTIETSRSRMELLEAFRSFRYPNDVGPGVYDIHSPRVPSVEEIETLIRRAASVLPPERLWVNPDCGLKTRGFEETSKALANMVEAARRARRALSGTPPC